MREPVAAAPAPVAAPPVSLATPLPPTIAAIEEALALPDPMPEPLPEPQARIQTAQDPRVSIEPFQPLASHYEMPQPQVVAPQMRAPEPPPVQQPYVPPVAERPLAARGRVPPIEEFPPIAQRQAAAGARPIVADEREEERRPLGLLRRLANGLGRHEEGDLPMKEEPRPLVQQPAARPQSSSEYAKRPLPQGAAGRLDPQGRVAPQPVSRTSDDEMEIPAFLRRK
jgi:cell division protein FtsZ